MLIEEKIIGAEFTIQAISDGRTVLFPPATYDYPFRFDGDEGPGTGGMGSLSMAAPTLPFMTAAHYERACSIIERVIERLAAQGRHFTGVMNSGFFATADGVKVIEFNARFGDPECMNIMSLFRGNWPDVMERMSGGELQPGRCAADARRRRSCCISSRPTTRCAPGDGLRVRPRPPRDRSGRLSRVLRLGRRDRRESLLAPWEPRARSRWRRRHRRSKAARERVVQSAGSVGVLEWRRDVGDESYLEGLSALVAGVPV